MSPIQIQTLSFVSCVTLAECLLVRFLCLSFLFSLNGLITYKGLTAGLGPAKDSLTLRIRAKMRQVRVQNDSESGCLTHVLALMIMMMMKLILIWRLP